jgi:hypothetical protein
MSPLEPRYSGDASIEFWGRIAGIRDTEGMLIYLAACALQEHEQRFFQMLKSIETARSPQATETTP